MDLKFAKNGLNKGVLTSFSKNPTTMMVPPLFRILKACLVVFSASMQSTTTSTPLPVIFGICSWISGAFYDILKV